jgi:hypothetical protein
MRITDNVVRKRKLAARGLVSLCSRGAKCATAERDDLSQFDQAAECQDYHFGVKQLSATEVI